MCIVNEEKEVYFDIYCKKCKNYKKPESEEPCNECLTNPYNKSHVPVNYISAEHGNKQC